MRFFRVRENSQTAPIFASAKNYNRLGIILRLPPTPLATEDT